MIARWKQIVAEVLDLADREAGPRRLQVRFVGLVVLAAVCTTLVKELAHPNGYLSWQGPLSLVIDDAPAILRRAFRGHAHAELARHAAWIGMSLAFFALLPLVYLRLVDKRFTLADVGLSLRGALSHWRIYAVLYAIVVPAVLVVGQARGFTKYYPLYREAGRSVPDLLAWELLYAAQFFAVELFYRGFLVLGTRRHLGAAAILLPIIPYCVLHFGKPLPEVLGSIVAGLVLGFLALMTRTIWLGVILHVAVALLVDLVALAAKGKLPL